MVQNWLTGEHSSLGKTKNLIFALAFAGLVVPCARLSAGRNGTDLHLSAPNHQSTKPCPGDAAPQSLRVSNEVPGFALEQQDCADHLTCWNWESTKEYRKNNSFE